MPTPYQQFVKDVKNCVVCQESLPRGANPVFQFHPSARILIAGQAPGRKVHETGIPFNDPSGDRLRSWLGISGDIFYDAKKIAILPMGFCYPGTGHSGDFPPRPECAKKWRHPMLERLSNLTLTLVIGQYAMDWHLPKRKTENVSDTVRNWRTFWPNIMPLPHPSPRNNIWLKKHPWFEAEVIPALQQEISRILAAR